MAIIKLLDDVLANKIAAGEVVERCASVVKELVENSIDAGSTEITIKLVESGIKEITVIDNGKGMDHDDAINCFSRHATSKIYDEDDLYHIATLGFRGEALASIASVSKVELITSMGDVGTTVNIEGGKIIDVINSDARVGTIMRVKELFYNTPARLKHLKSLQTELYNIVDYINKISLAHPFIRFSLYSDGRNVFSTDGSGNVLKIINNIYGLSIAKKMIEVKNSNNDYEITGYISLPEVHRANRNGIVTIVNGRNVRNSELNRYINEAYHSYKPDNRYPIVVLNINVDTSLVDVNIHLTKMDIKFGKQEVLNDLVFQTIREALRPKTLIPHIEEHPNPEIANPYFDNKLDDKALTNKLIVGNVKHKFENLKLNFDEPKNEESDLTINSDLVVKEEETNYEVHEDVKEKLPIIYPVGLVHGTYIICQNENGMYIIDQHAAKERINYEMVKKKLAEHKKESISMIIPLTIEYTNDEFIKLKENLDLLRDLNFDIEEFGVSSVIVKAHPVWIPSGNENEGIKRIIEVVLEKEKDFDMVRFYDNVSATVACKMSIKANTNITIEEMQQLIDDLRKCDNPFNCPHGRPTVIYYSKSDLEKLFKRSGF